MRKILSIIFMLLSITMFSITACNTKTETEQAKEEINEAGEAIADAWQAERTELEAKLKQTQINLNSRIDQMQKDLDAATAEAKGEIQEQLDKLETERRKASTQLKRFGDVVDDGWNDFRNEVELTIKDIERSIEK